MAKVKLELKELTVLDKVALLKRVADGLENHADVPDPKVTPAALRAAADELLAKENAVRTAERAVTTAVEVRDGKEDEADKLLSDAAKDAEEKTGGDAAKLGTTNLPLRDEPAPIGALSAPTGLRLTAGDADGELDVQWDRLRGAQFYEVQLREVSGTEWATKLSDTKSKGTIDGLPSGKRYHARVRAKGAAGWSPWSDEAGPKTAP